MDCSIHLSCTLLLLFALTNHVDVHQSTVHEFHHRHKNGESVDMMNDHNPHHPLHPDWKFTYHRVLQQQSPPLGNETLGVSGQSTKKRRAIVAMSIVPNRSRGRSDSLEQNMDSLRDIKSDGFKWVSTLEKELVQSLSKGRNEEEEFHWRPWIQHVDHVRHSHPVPVLSPPFQHHHKRRHWKRHGQQHRESG